jgi:hypothetical protein
MPKLFVDTIVLFKVNVNSKFFDCVDSICAVMNPVSEIGQVLGFFIPIVVKNYLKAEPETHNRRIAMESFPYKLEAVKIYDSVCVVCSKPFHHEQNINKPFLLDAEIFRPGLGPMPVSDIERLALSFVCCSESCFNKHKN